MLSTWFGTLYFALRYRYLKSMLASDSYDCLTSLFAELQVAGCSYLCLRSTESEMGSLNEDCDILTDRGISKTNDLCVL